MLIPNIPETASEELREVIEELIYIAKMADESGESDIKFEFNNPASEDEISNCEEELEIVFTDDYKNFMKFSNGSQLCFTEANFYDIDYVCSMNKREKASDFPKDYIVLADIIGDGEILCFSKNTNTFIRYFDGNEKRFDTFIDFMKHFISKIRDSVEEYVEL